MSNAATLFNLITSKPTPAEQAAEIHRLIKEAQTETDWLDFKQAAHLTNPKDSKHKLDEKWGKYLSAFANTEGGVLIWGVQADENKVTKKDCAHALSYAPNPGELLSRLEQLAPTLTNPPVPGVKYFDIVDPASTGGGFVLCYVPLSPHRPHRAEFNENYYMRFGSHCLHPSPEVLKALFHPRREANFELSFSASSSLRENYFSSARFTMTIRNIGGATAQEPYIVITSKNRGLAFSSVYPWPEVNPPGEVDGYRKGFAGKSSLHPGVSSATVSISTNFDGSDFAPESQRDVQTVEFGIEVFCLNQSPRKYRVAFSSDEVARHLHSPITKLADPIE